MIGSVTGATRDPANIFVIGIKYPQLPFAWGILTGHFFAEKRLPSTTSMPGGSNSVPFS